MANDNIAVQKLKLGIGLPNSGSMYVYAKQYDGNSRKIVAEILDSDGPISLAGNSVRLNATLPNGEKLYMDGQVEDNKATFLLTADFLALDGTAACDISVINDTGDGLLLTSSTFYIVVSQSNFDENAPGSYPSSVIVSTMLKPDMATEGNIAVFDNNKNVVDSGKSASDFAPSAENGYVEKQTTTSATPRVYTYTSEGDSYLPVIRAENTPKSIVQRTTGGQIVTGDPTLDIHAATKKYVDTNFAPKATNGYVEKKTTTSGSWRVYVYNNDGDNYLPAMSGLDGTVAPTATGNIAATTSGRIRTNTPTGPYHAANKKYVDERVVANDNTGTSGGYLSTIKIGGVSYTIGTLPCLIEGTKILMADDTEKNIEDVTSGDLIKSYNPTTQEITDAVVMGCYKTGEEHQFNHFTYSNGKSLTVFGVHGYYSPDSGIIKDINTSKFGTKVLDTSLEECVLIDRRPIGKYGKAKSRYNLISSNNLYFANGILLGGRPVHKYHYCLRTNEEIPNEIETVLSQDCEDYNDFISVIDNPRFILEAKDAFIASSQAYNIVKADKERLEKTDYKTLKHTEGKISDEEYAEALKERDALRQEINEQQEIYLTNLRVIKRLKTQYRNGETERSLFEKCCDRDNAAIDQFRAWLTPIKEETNDEA